MDETEQEENVFDDCDDGGSGDVDDDGDAFPDEEQEHGGGGGGSAAAMPHAHVVLDEHGADGERKEIVYDGDDTYADSVAIMCTHKGVALYVICWAQADGSDAVAVAQVKDPDGNTTAQASSGPTDDELDALDIGDDGTPRIPRTQLADLAVRYPSDAKTALQTAMEGVEAHIEQMQQEAQQQ
jgi:hypothetical protein